MGEPMIIDVDEVEMPEMKSPPDQDKSGKKSSLKRRRAALLETLNTEDRENQIEAFQKELDGLMNYYKEIILDQKLDLDVGGSLNGNSTIACLLEECSLPLSKLVDEIYEKMKVHTSVSAASVKSYVLLIGQRSFYGVPNLDADVLEDDTESSLWCWETKDVKLLPQSIRRILKNRRSCRKKIHERITAVSDIIMALKNLESSQNCREELIKLAARLVKVPGEADIRSSIGSMLQKNASDMTEKDVKQEEKFLAKQLEKNKREVEKETKRNNRELQKEKLHSEKEEKKQEEERDQRRKEKEEAELKKQLALQKQASFMEGFLKRRKNNSPSLNEKSLSKATVSDTSLDGREDVVESVTILMDHTLSSNDKINAEHIWKLHLITWRQLGHSIRSNNTHHWGIRRNPKTELVKELKLINNQGMACDDDLSMEKTVDGWNEANIDGLHNTNADISSYGRRHKQKQLLQFDKNHRPAFYGIWQKKSQIVGPRRPFAKDQNLDYDIDSDEEWEEEEPGESLSDCDKDDEEESLEEGYSKADDEDESEDSFFVPDGYLSENEGVEVDRMETNNIVEEARSSPTCKQDSENEEFNALLRRQKYLNNLTEQSLRKNKPLIILNLMHEKAPLSSAEDITSTMKLEQTCLQALSMFAFPGGPSIEISIDTDMQENQEACQSSGKGNVTPVIPTPIQDSDLPHIVSAIQSFPQGINKVVEALLLKFPSISKCQLRNKVREISDFTDNRWQVKKDILDKLGLSTSPEKDGERRKSIATFFSKRCLPPACSSINLSEASLESSEKCPLLNQHNDTNNNF